MRRTVAFLLAFCLAVLGTGIVQHLHDRQHEQATEASCPAKHGHSDKPSAPAGEKCDLCVLLHQPLIAQTFAPSLVIVLAPAGEHRAAPVLMIEHARVDRPDCRGPPAVRSQIV